MNISKITFLAFGGLVLAGCMSLEERLASSDIRVRNEAERELVFNAYKCGAPKSERLAAIKRVKNQNFLEYLAMSANDSSKDDGLAAVENIEDVPVLIKVAQNAASMDVRKAASTKIQDEKVLCDIACGKFGWEGAAGEALCMDAQSRLKDASLIATVAERSQSAAAAKTAFGRLSETERQRIAIASGKSDYLCDEIKGGRINEKIMETVFEKGDAKTKKAFIEACENESLLMQVVERYGTKLSGDECAALTQKANMPKLKTRIGVIADKKIVEELEQSIKVHCKDYPDEKEKSAALSIQSIQEKFALISDQSLRVSILKANLENLHNSGNDLRPVAEALFGELTAEEAIELFSCFSPRLNAYQFVGSLSDEVFAQLLSRKKLDPELMSKLAMRIENDIKNGKGKVDADAFLRGQVNFLALYWLINKPETAAYIWENATLNGYDAAPAIGKCLWEKMSNEMKKKFRDQALSNADKIKNRKPVFCGLYIGMPLRDCGALLYEVEDYVFTSKYCQFYKEYKCSFLTYEETIKDWRTDGLVRKIKLSRAERYKVFPHEDRDFWPDFMREFMPKQADKKESAAEIIGGALDAAFGNYERAYSKELKEWCYVLKSMKYGVRVWYGLESGTLIIEAFEG